MMDTLSNDPEDGSLQKKKAKKFRLFGKKKSQPAQLDPNCPQCNPHLLVALEQQQRQQQLYLQQQQQLQYHHQLQQQQQQMLARAKAEASAAGRGQGRRAMDDSPGAIVEDYGDDDDDDEIKVVASSSTAREGGAAAAGGARVACDCHRCQQERSERQLTVELLPMDTQVPLQNMMQDAAVFCSLL
ncbi:AF4/FMR2 family member lilli [Dermacentor silvarum]|nr:AF4/FMR2 family member lilli [Dermacentor silvarum]